MRVLETLIPARLAAGLALLLLLAVGSAGGAQRATPGGSGTQAGAGLYAFQSDAELRAFLRRIRPPEPEVQAVASAPAPVPSVAAPAEAIVVTGSRVSSPSITNTQEAGVDEGGIVKVSGNTLVILRRGKLHTVSLAGGRMRPIHSIDAFPPGVDARSDWYDEMLLAGDRVVVVGYSYRRGGTEINRFRLGADGRLRFEDATHLRSNDYYSSRNYASRLIGNRLIYYTPLYLGGGRDPLDALPGVRRWRGDASDRAFRRITEARQVFIPPAMLNGRTPCINALHSVINCDLTAPALNCSATAVLGPASRTFYVSGQAV